MNHVDGWRDSPEGQLSRQTVVTAPVQQATRIAKLMWFA